jgi:hypothetical protein
VGKVLRAFQSCSCTVREESIPQDLCHMGQTTFQWSTWQMG